MIKNVVNKENVVTKISTLAHVKVEEKTEICFDKENLAVDKVKRVSKRKCTVLKDISETHYELPDGGLYTTRSKRRRIEAVPGTEESDQPFGMKSKRGPRAPRKPRAPRAPRNPRKRNK